jgi:MFS family permease
MNGFDGALFNSLSENTDFLDYFHGANAGPWQAKVACMYQVGGVIALPFVGPAIDTWGRRWGMFIGSVLIVIGTVVQGTSIYSANIGQFMGGRFLVGFAVAIASAAGPMYVVEVSHPAYRGIMTAFYNTWW